MSTQLEDLSGDQRYKFEKLTNLQFNTRKVITTLLAIIYFMLKVFQHQILEKCKKISHQMTHIYWGQHWGEWLIIGGGPFPKI